MFGLVVALSSAGTAHAGRPLDTDDAAVIPAGACQLESFVRRVGARSDTGRSTEVGLAPSCNPFGRSELLVGGERDGMGSDAPVTHGVLQFKTVPAPVTAERWGWGFSGALDEGFLRGRARPAGRLSTLYSIVSAPIVPGWQVDANLGWIHEWTPALQGHRNHVLWAVASEWAVSPRVGLVAERVGASRFGSRSLLGTTFALSNAVTLDAAVGRRRQPDDRGIFVQAGVTIVLGTNAGKPAVPP